MLLFCPNCNQVKEIVGARRAADFSCETCDVPLELCCDLGPLDTMKKALAASGIVRSR